jgi:hypothetical protein
MLTASSSSQRQDPRETAKRAAPIPKGNRARPDVTGAVAVKTEDAVWPALPLANWKDTLDTLHMWTQIVGKTRLALAPMQNHWWNVTLYVTARGLTTSAMPYESRAVEVEFDFLDSNLHLRLSDGDSRSIPLEPQSVADFYAAYTSALTSLGISVPIHPVPVEIERAIPFAQDREHASYDADAAVRWWRVLLQTDRVLERFRSDFMGKASPVHFFWGSFDLASTRFSGRAGPPHPGGVPNCPDYVMVEAYSRECSSWGFWPGGGVVNEPAFYAYAYPEPAGYSKFSVRPTAARYVTELGEFVLPYDAVRSADNPDEMLLEFCRSTYDAAATLGKWDRAMLDRSEYPGQRK